MNMLIKKIFGDRIIVQIRTILKFHRTPGLKEALRSNETLKDIHKGEKCFVLGNGPSLKHIDFGLLENEYVFTVNQLSRNNEFYKLKTNFHMWVDELFFDIDDTLPEDQELLQTHKMVNTDDNRPIVFYKYEAHSMIKKYKLDEQLNVKYFTDIWYDQKKRIPNKYIDCTKPMPVLPSVTCYAICMAVYMGFSEVYLLGCDCTGFLSIGAAKLKQVDNIPYAYKISKNEKKRLEKSYAKRNTRDELWWYVDLFDTYEIMRDYCKKNGVALYNATEGSLLESIPRVSLNDVLNNRCTITCRF